jgi:hypothetical protein
LSSSSYSSSCSSTMPLPPRGARQRVAAANSGLGFGPSIAGPPHGCAARSAARTEMAGARARRRRPTLAPSSLPLSFFCPYRKQVRNFWMSRLLRLRFQDGDEPEQHQPSMPWLELLSLLHCC